MFFFKSFLYSIFQISQGLLIHPYQTMQSLVRQKIFIWMSLLPTFFLASLTLIWKEVIVTLLKRAFSCQGSAWVFCELLTFLSDWITFFCVYWQLLLFYLLFRFDSAFQEK